MQYTDNITSLKGIGEKTAGLFHKLNITTLYDLITFFPRDYEQFGERILVSQAAGQEPVTLKLTLTGDYKYRKFASLGVGTITAADESGQLVITYYNAPYLKNTLKRGMSYYAHGKVRTEKSRIQMDQPKLYTEEQYQALMRFMQPKYALTKGLSAHMVSKAVSMALDGLSFAEYLPEDIRMEYQLSDIGKAYRQIHFPEDYESLLLARKRLAFDELFSFFMHLHRQKEITKETPSEFFLLETADTGRLIEALPYKLTKAQMRTWQEIKDDLTGGIVMNRLVQGDVGSGKTILAFLSLLLVAANGYQGAMMAPTEILARQHYEELCHMAETYHLPVRPVLLTGSVSTAEKKKRCAGIEKGDYNVVIGTSALIQEKVTYQKLVLVITDEQHRFGVRQREAFLGKGEQAHVLVMSATPIPRTLAIILYGDMHLSLVDEKPADRLPVKNCVITRRDHKKAVSFLIKETQAGHQAYVICPMVEENEDMEGVADVISYTAALKKELPEQIRVAYLHGRMRPSEKDRIMEAYLNRNIDVLVSTTVIEVGINVPNATVMMIENAERFGLAQLHQLRGRIGRGTAQSYCIFVDGSGKDSPSERLQVLNKSNDGFYIAEEDLKMRGPGDLFGIRQSGIMNFKVADIYQDSSLLMQVRKLVEDLLMDDPGLTAKEHESIRGWLSLNFGNLVDFRSI